MNIDDVKVRLSNLEYGKVVKYDHAMNLATQYMLDYRNDVTYLLSIIEQATNFYEKVEEWESFSKENVLEASGKHMKAIRGN